nr:MAG TPA: tail protein [Bacteriophage sp.]
MIIKINNKDISNDINIISAIIDDNAGDIYDSLQICISDIDNDWRIWDIDTDESIEIIKNGFSSGIMYIDTVEIDAGKCIVKANPLKRKYKELKSSTLENINFLNLANTIANRLNLDLETYDLVDYTYDRLDQISKTDFSFLVSRCILEGYRAKITNDKLIIYNEKTFENLNSIQVFTPDEFIGKYKLKKSNLNTFSKCEIQYFAKDYIKTECIDNKINASTLKPNLRVSDVIESNRFGFNLLKYKNKYINTASFCINLNTNLAGSSTISLENIGAFSGKYFIENIKHDFVNDKSYIYARKVD